jgi:AcrR family transcriptional regulator
MVESARAVDASPRRARAERILDVAAELLLRLGYKRVTIEDVADRAEIGKGTIYLHWKSREALFFAVIEREYLQVIEELLIALRQEPETALLHVMTRAYFLHVMRRPLLRAVLISDLELLGRMGKAADRMAMEARGQIVFNDYLQLLHEHGLIRSDGNPCELLFAYQATIGGYFIQEEAASEEHRVPLGRKADLLATTMRRTFEPDQPPAPDAIRAVAPRVIEIFEEIGSIVRAHRARAFE